MNKKDQHSQNSALEGPQPNFNPLYLLIPLAFGIGLLMGYAIWGRSAPVAQVNAAPAGIAQVTQVVQPTEQVRRYPVPVDDDPAIGPENAAITIIEFSDYECPYCRRWFEEVYRQLFKAYPNQVRLVFRDFPLTSIHSNAQAAAEAANCANEQGAYWSFHDKLFGMSLGLSSEAYLQYANDLNLDMDQFEACINERRYQDEVLADLKYAANLGINSTPTFFINGIPVVGAQPFEVFKYVIDKELAGEFPD